MLDLEWDKLYYQLFEDRQEADYIALVSFDSEYVEKQMVKCKEFLAALRPLIQELKK